MKPSVSYSKVYPIAQYGINERIGVDYIEIEEGETIGDALTRVQKQVMDWAKENITDPTLPERSFPVEIKTVKENSIPVVDTTNAEFKALRETIEEAPTKEMALLLIAKSNFKYNIDLKKIANGKAESIS